MSLTVTLKPRDAGALQRYADEVSTPGSSVYHQYLSVAQFRDAFGPTAATISAVESSLRAHGLKPGAVSANGLAISVDSTAAKVGKAFSTSFERVKVGSRTAFRNTSAPLVDSTVAGKVQGVLGLDSLAVRHPVGLKAATAGSNASPNVVTGGPQPCSAASSVGEHTADQLASAYRFSSMYGAGDLGAGQTVALYELEPNSTSDIAAYQSCYGTSASVSYVKVDGGSGTGAGQGEAALDIEDVIGLAPQAAIRVYQGPNTQAGALDTYNSIVSQNIAKVISTSWGLCEAEEGSADANSENTLFQEAATQGQSIFAASGDTGSEDCRDRTTTLAVDDPGTQPYVTSTGGTTLSSLGPPPTQSVWNNSIGAGGGGISSFWTMPSYQSGAPSSLNVINAYSSKTPCGSSSAYCREVPDVSADADPNTGYAIYYNGSWGGIGGTSAAAPTWAAFVALANASSACSGTSVGFANAALYRAAGTAYSSDFSDITSGNNDFGNHNGGKYPAGTGFDEATGLGSMVGSTLPAGLCGSGGGGGNTVTVTNPGNQTSTVGTAVSLTVHATDSGGAALTYSATGLPAGLSINSSTGVISGTPTTAGTYSVTVKATDTTSASGSASFTWTVNPSGGGGCTAKQLLGNPGFETGSASPWTTTAGVVNPSSAGEAAHSGNYLAWLDGYGSTHTDTLAQSVTIPAGCTNYTFSYWLHIDTAETTTTTKYDTLSVQVLNSSGTVLATLASYSNLNKISGYAQHSSSLAAYAGQTVTIKFTGKEDVSLETSFVVDDAALNVS